VRVAAVQYSPESDRQANLVRVAGLLDAAGEAGCDLVVLPEIFSAPFVQPEVNKEYFAYAEPLDGGSNSMVSSKSLEHGFAVLSPIFEASSLPSVYYNSACLFVRGEMVAVYRKSHLPFSNGFPEKYYFRPADNTPTVTPVNGVRTSTIICYERHFPELPRLAALAGAEVLLVPVACSSEPTRRVFQVELQAHAVTNGMFLVCANRIGLEGDKRYYGMSAIYGPDGTVLQEASNSGDEVVLADIDVSAVAEARRTLPFFRDRRPELYSALAQL
jgi:beta-ureidopropionase